MLFDAGHITTYEGPIFLSTRFTITARLSYQ